MDLKLESFGDAYSALIISPIAKMQDGVSEACSQLVESGPILYVSLNKEYLAAKDLLEKHGVKTDTISFVDTLGKFSDLGTTDDQVTRIENPADLTSLNIAITEFLKKNSNKGAIVVDALATLLIYNSEDLAVKFVKDLVLKSRDAKTLVFTPDAKGTSFIEKVSVFFDQTIFDSVTGE